MISYKLAKKLKDAGFSQKLTYGSFFIGKDESTHLADGLGRDGWEDDSFFKIPNLSELIEACGKDFGELMQSRDYSYWMANDMKGEASGKGKTPEESVTKLWLKLNK